MKKENKFDFLGPDPKKMTRLLLFLFLSFLEKTIPKMRQTNSMITIHVILQTHVISISFMGMMITPIQTIIEFL